MKCIPSACCNTGSQNQWQSNTDHCRWQNLVVYSDGINFSPYCTCQRYHRFVTGTLYWACNNREIIQMSNGRVFFIFCNFSYCKRFCYVSKKQDCPGLRQQRKTAAPLKGCLPRNGLNMPQKWKETNKTRNKQYNNLPPLQNTQQNPQETRFSTCKTLRKSLMFSFLFSQLGNKRNYLTVSKAWPWDLAIDWKKH